MDTFIRQQVDYPTVKVNVDRIKADESGADAERRGEQPADFALLQRPGGAQSVAQSAERSELPSGRTDADIQRADVRRDAAHADHGPRPAASTSNCWTIWRALQRTTSPEIESHYNVQPVIDVYASPDRRDLGGFAADVTRIIDKVRARRCRVAPRSTCAGR